MSEKSMIVTAGLPYANGEIHLGHLVEYLQADFWTRFQKMRGRDCRYFCADDTHGTPIMVAARKQGITPEALIAASKERHLKDFHEFQIEFDNYSSTHSETNKEICSSMFLKIKEAGYITERPIQQAFCEHDNMFLPDRFIKGTCPKCKSEDQYGDSCDSCGATYSTTDLIDSSCAVCSNKPTSKESNHIFFKLNEFKEFLRDWLSGHTSKEVSNKMLEWFDDDLRDWDISRDAPYFGFEIPGYKDKYFYVWVDAPVGYMASAKEFTKKNNMDFESYWNDSEIYHFIGKDIVYFHTLFWPAMLKAAGFNRPSQVYVHGMLTVNGVKMSKSKGTFINARTYLDHLDPSFLRYYYACKFNSGMEDVDLNLEDFSMRVNSDLVGKITNLASRGAQMLSKRIDGKMGSVDPESKEMIKAAQDAAADIADLYHAREFSKAIRRIRDIADEANRYFDEKAPWKMIKQDPEATRMVLTTTLNIFRMLAVYLKPVLPDYAKKVEALFGETNFNWQSSQTLIENKKINDYVHLAKRVEPDLVKKVVEASKTEKEVPKKTPKKAKASDPNAKSEEIDFESFMKVDLRVARIAKAEHIEGAEKLLKLTLDVGELGTKQVFAGIKAAYKPEDIEGKLTVMVANLAPRKMKFGMSEGMVLAAGPGGDELSILYPDQNAKPGQRIK